jgi:hypothetical protein
MAKPFPFSLAEGGPRSDTADVGKRNTALILSLLLLAGLWVGFWALTPTEPAYQGRSASSWLDDIPGPKNSPEAHAALKAMGSNAAPSIIRKLRQSESTWQTKYRNLYPKLPARLAKFLPRPKAEFHYYDGAGAFLDIGPSVEPILIHSLKDRSMSARGAAALSLGYLHVYDGADIREAIAGLTEDLHDESKKVQLSAAASLGCIGPEAASSVPALIPLLNDSDTESGTSGKIFIRSQAARTLGKIGPKAKAALPGLRSLLAEKDNYLTVVTAIAIWRIDADVTNTLPFLIDGLTQLEVHSRWEVLEGMSEMGPRAKVAVPFLLSELGLPPNPSPSARPYSYNRQKILDALQQIDPETAAKVAVK